MKKTEGKKLIRAKQLCEKLSIANSTLYSIYMKRDDFPKSIKIGGNNAWVESEIDSWIESERVKQNEGGGWHESSFTR
ncbi:MAG: AlpA family phage regulatory protein [Gammaproteobacteria bacterium]|nr:AlpA family phage regulatory protein [Gammaproteobacteria bacterium]